MTSDRSEWTPFIGGVYGIRTFSSREFRYVGMSTVSVEHRFKQHLKLAHAGKKRPVYDWMRKHQADLYAVPLEVVTTTLEDLGAAEVRWIARLRRGGHRLLNLTDGGLGPRKYVWTDEQRDAARERATGRSTGVSRRGPDSPNWGRAVHTEEQKQRWSEVRKGTLTGPANPNFGKFGTDHPSYGHAVSQETRELLSEQKRGANNPNFGKAMSAAERQQRSEALKGRPMPSSVRNAHTRHHTNKGLIKDSCRHCQDDIARLHEGEQR